MSRSLALLSLLALAPPSLAQSFSIKVVPTPDPGPFQSLVSALAAPSVDEAWAVGEFLDAGAVEKTLAIRFDGANWIAVPSANQGTQQDDLTGVAAPAPGDVWAVGGSMFSNGTQITLVQHWNGSQFVIVPSPNPTGTTGNSRLNAICALAPDNLWAAGEFIASGQDILPLVEHWDGSTWTIVPTTVGAGVIFVNGIAAVGPADIWAVGESEGAVIKPFSMHWNGVKWSAVNVPSPTGATETHLKAVGATPSGVVFAVGSYNNEKTLVERWTGSAWVIVPSVDDSTQSRFFGLNVRSASDVTVVGSSFLPSGFQKSLVEWFDGTSFHVVASPNEFASNTPFAVATPPCGPGWIVGGGDQPPSLKTEAMRIAGPGGPVTDLGGGCGAGGTLAVLGPVSLGSDVVLKLSGADAAASIGLLNVAAVGPPTSCGPCALVPYQLFVLLALSGGGASLTATLPCDPALLGAAAVLQWTVGPTSATGCALLGAHRALSNAVQVTIGN
jgi:hypothetical protein